MTNIQKDVETYAPYLLEGVTAEMTLAVLREKLGAESVTHLEATLDPRALLTLAADVWRRERLLKLWDEPRDAEEQQIVQLVAAGIPLGLDSLITPGPVDGVTPTLYRLPTGEWQLGSADEPGPVFACATPQRAVELAFAWLGAGEDIGL